MRREFRTDHGQPFPSLTGLWVADQPGVASVCATTREPQVSYQSISQQMERATSSRTTGARCQSLHSRHGMQASIRTSLRR